MNKTISMLLALGVSFFAMSCNDCDHSDNDDGMSNELNSFTETLRPSALEGVDAFVYDFEPDRNLGTHPDFVAATGTNGGVELIVRSFIRFDFSIIPSDAIVDSVKLSLYSYDSPSNGSHFWEGESNTCLIQKVDSQWSENLISWNNQPSSSEENQVVLDRSENEIQDYLNIDMTELAKGMINSPSTNNGFVIKLETEEIYKRMIFGSSDNPDASLHPKMVIHYSR